MWNSRSSDEHKEMLFNGKQKFGSLGVFKLSQLIGRSSRYLVPKYYLLKASYNEYQVLFLSTVIECATMAPGTYFNHAIMIYQCHWHFIISVISFELVYPSPLDCIVVHIQNHFDQIGWCDEVAYWFKCMLVTPKSRVRFPNSWCPKDDFARILL